MDGGNGGVSGPATATIIASDSATGEFADDDGADDDGADDDGADDDGADDDSSGAAFEPPIAAPDAVAAPDIFNFASVVFRTRTLVLPTKIEP